MPLDPSIIANSMSNMAANMPDVNALMQQRVQGMENIYRIETARQEQAKLAQQEAAQKAAEAMLPAVAAAFSDPTDAGLDAATSLLPPEVASAFTPFMQRLKGIPDPKSRMSILRAELAKDEEGRFILGQLEPSANMQLQAATAAQRAAIDMRRLTLDEQKQALDAEGKGAWELKEGESGFFWTNPRTREVVPANVTGTAPGAVPGAAPGTSPIPAPLPSSDLVTPRQPAPGAPQVAPPISVAQPPAEQPGPQFKPKPKAEKAADLTEREGKSVNFAIRMADSDAIANELEKEGVVTTDTVSNFFTGVVNALPMSAGANLATQLENAFNAAMPTMSPEEQRLAGAQLDFITAVLRSESGAEIKTSEFPAEYRKYFAVAGDENNPKLLTDKKRRRRNAIEGMKAQAGERGRTEIDRILNEQGVGASAVTPPAPGATLDGFEYQGVEE